MPNNKYANSTRRELAIKKEFEEQQWYAIRASGSHGIADVVALRPSKDGLYEVKFIQVKTSQKILEEAKALKTVEAICGQIPVEFWYFPVRNTKNWALVRKQKLKKKTQ